MNWGYKFFLGLIFIIAAAAAGSSLILQYYFAYSPCPLCILQRLSVLIIAVLALLLLFLPLAGQGVRLTVTAILSVPAWFGLGTAIRQIYLQNLPPEEIPTCGPGWNFLFANNHFFGFLRKVFMGSGECAQLEKFWGLPLSQWGFLTFAVIVLLLFTSVLIKQK